MILDGTTLDEVERYHKETLLLVVAKTNDEYREIHRRKMKAASGQTAVEEAHRRHVEDVAGCIKFDE